MNISPSNPFDAGFKKIHALKSDSVSGPGALSKSSLDRKIKSMILDMLSSLDSTQPLLKNDLLLKEHFFEVIDIVSSEKEKIELKEKVLFILNMLPEEQKISHQLKNLMDQVKVAATMEEVQGLCQVLETAAQFINSNNTPKLETEFLSICDQLSTRLLHKGMVHSQENRPLPLDGASNWQERVQLAANIRCLAGTCPVGAKALKMENFKSTRVKKISLIGNKMDPGIYYQNIDAQKVSTNQVMISRRNMLKTPQDTQPFEMRTQMKLQLTPQAREELANTLKAFQTGDLAQALTTHIGLKVTVTENVKINYEVSQSHDQHEGVASFVESQANYAIMTRIDIEGLGQVFIGTEDMSVSEKAEADASSKGRYLAHHSVIVRLNDDPLLDEMQIDSSAQVNKMHRLLSTVGLSSVLTNSSPEEKQKSHLLLIIETYLPHLAFQLKNSTDFINKDVQAMQKFCLELLPETSEEEMTRQEMHAIFDEELNAGPQSEKTVIGSEVPKLSNVANHMRQEGALGFFAGIHNNPSIVASVLKTGSLSADVRCAMGFKFPSTCQEDAVTGGNDAVFVRLATEGTLDKMAQGKAKLTNCPYIQTYQMIASLDLANLPHNRMHHSSYGLINPQSDIIQKQDDVVKERVSGVQLFSSDNPIQFTKRQNEEFSEDNELMLRIGAMNPQYIQKITYQDPRKELLELLKIAAAPSDLIQQVEGRILTGGNIPGHVKSEVENFMKTTSLVSEEDNWNKTKKELVLKGINTTFKFGDKLQAYFVDPKAALIEELIENGLIDDQYLIFGKPVDEFIVETNTLTRNLFIT